VSPSFKAAVGAVSAFRPDPANSRVKVDGGYGSNFLVRRLGQEGLESAHCSLPYASARVD
jgi:hypothetical protein